jgi:hypothetical protein
MIFVRKEGVERQATASPFLAIFSLQTETALSLRDCLEIFPRNSTLAAYQTCAPIARKRRKFCDCCGVDFLTQWSRNAAAGISRRPPALRNTE